MRIPKATLALIPFLALAGASDAATLLSESNAQSIFLPLGIGMGNGQQAAAIEFSTTNPLTNVTISVPLDILDTGQNASISAYLTNSFGPGTTQSNVIASVNLSVAPNNSVYDYYHYVYQTTNETLFSGLNLTPGTYNVVLVELDGTGNAGIPLDFYGGDYVSAPGVSLLGTFSTSQQSGTFAPGFGGWGDTRQGSIFTGPLEFSITGNDLVPNVPEPGLGFVTGFLTLGLGAYRCRRPRKG